MSTLRGTVSLKRLYFLVIIISIINTNFIEIKIFENYLFLRLRLKTIEKRPFVSKILTIASLTLMVFTENNRQRRSLKMIFNFTIEKIYKNKI